MNAYGSSAPPLPGDDVSAQARLALLHRARLLCLVPAMKRLFCSIACRAALALVCAASRLHADLPQLSKEDVETIIANSATEAARIDPRALIAITDRDGFVLAVWDMAGRIPNPVPAFSFDQIGRAHV